VRTATVTVYVALGRSLMNVPSVLLIDINIMDNVWKVVLKISFLLINQMLKITPVHLAINPVLPAQVPLKICACNVKVNFTLMGVDAESSAMKSDNMRVCLI